MPGLHLIAVDLEEGWISEWLAELIGWPARYEAWLQGE